MKKLFLKLVYGILVLIFNNAAYSQNFKNKSAEEFGFSIFKSIKNNDFESFSNYFPIVGDTAIFISRKNSNQKVLITSEMLNDLKIKFRDRFQDLQNELVMEMNAQNLDSSQLILKRINTEIKVRNATLYNTAGIEIFLEIWLGNKLVIIQIEDCIKTKNGYFLFDSIKIEFNEMPTK